MRLRNNPQAPQLVASSIYSINNYLDLKGKYDQIFNNDNPICIEIGCGKGKFIINMAMKYPNINFIGIEKYPTVLAKALSKVQALQLSNLKFICLDATIIDQVFAHEIDTIYLNFSDPWPKKSHHKRRLTSNIFLVKYEAIFKNIPHIIMKTDNLDLFNYSLDSLSTFNYNIIYKTNDLNNVDEITTEYEDKFRSQGIKINKLEAIKKC